jgi:hypothetical protein
MIIGMAIGMIKDHPTENRMLRQAEIRALIVAR